MKKPEKIVFANWKMNPETPEEARKIWAGTKRVGEKLKKTQVIVCPPFLFLPHLAKLATPKVTVGAQDTFWEEKGARTGEISPSMLKQFGASHVIVGHSERRALGETNEVVAKKIAAVMRQEMTAVLCVGESTRDEQGNYLAFLKEELMASLSTVQKKHLFYLVIAYEPIWAIGKSDREALGAAGIHEMVIFIRKILNDVYGAEFAAKVPIIYGGSVGPTNAGEIMRDGHVDGFLVGHQSLEPEKFRDVLNAVDSM